eukprot:CAMPEP_0197539868 /NCGR_PEP_ID=MMETSP1318-20131121/64043_1 /TAXON_ID=552666 /ORGANISM="Partenskyella glossopodia, Strain RCC365" /LENGTH=198 /DNA_ID=CAMNT_0043098697 /DNA_START=84 /DNA_END=678 /DNA_ORIENTATION=+
MRKSSGDPYRCVLAKKKKKTSLFEDLHADTLMLKRRNKKLDQENKELRTAIQRLTHLIKRKDRGIYRVLSLSEHQSSSTPRLIQEIRSDMISMTSLNSRLRSMEKDLKKTEAELDELKSSTKHTRIREVQIKSEVYRDECERITRLLDQLKGLDSICLALFQRGEYRREAAEGVAARGAAMDRKLAGFTVADGGSEDE